MNYYSGVYVPDTTSGLLGGHCVMIVGWGVDAGTARGLLLLLLLLLLLVVVVVVSGARARGG